MIEWYFENRREQFIGSEFFERFGENALLIIPEGSSFEDMVALKGKADIGDQINKKIIAPIADETVDRGG